MIECKLLGCSSGEFSGGIIFSFVIPELDKYGFQCNACNRVWWVRNLENLIIEESCKDTYDLVSVVHSYYLYLKGKLVIGKPDSEEYRSGLYKSRFRAVFNDSEYYKFFWEELRKSEAHTNRILYSEGLPPIKPLEEENN